MIDRHEDSSKIVVSKWLAGIVLSGFFLGASGLIWLGGELNSANSTARRAGANSVAMQRQSAKLYHLTQQVALLRQEVQYDEKLLNTIADTLRTAPAGAPGPNPGGSRNGGEGR